MRRIEKRTNPAIFLLLMGFAVSAIAEPKMLVCESTAEAEAEEERMRGIATEYRDKIENSRREEDKTSYESSAKRFDAYGDVCKNAKYGSQYNFTFDTKGLSSTEFSNVEVQVNEVCGALVTDVIKGTMEATPSIISFQWESGISMTSARAFNVDRKNLTAGHDTERDLTCVLSDIDTSENLL